MERSRTPSRRPRPCSADLDPSPVRSESEKVDYEPPTDPAFEEDPMMHIVPRDAVESPVSNTSINVCTVPSAWPSLHSPSLTCFGIVLFPIFLNPQRILAYL